MASREITVEAEIWPLRSAFTIARGSKTEANVIVVEIRENGKVGRGESVPYPRYNETVDEVIALIKSHESAIKSGMDRSALQSVMAAGAARNAVDCALWDLEAKLLNNSVWRLAELNPPKAVITAVTISLDTPEAMGKSAAKLAGAKLLKIKLNDQQIVERIRSVRNNAPDSRIILDANESWTPELLKKLSSELASLGVEMIEQPLPAGEDAILSELDHPVPLCADESCHTSEDIDKLKGLYEWINIKLDKTGGLTEARKLAFAAQDRGFDLMVGCMVGTSLAMAPATLLGTYAKVVDLDGPLLLAEDRPQGLRFEESYIYPPETSFWG
jgi:L-alanine-DL-glutamate epimerase-like enolase superfamily enzyme